MSDSRVIAPEAVGQDDETCLESLEFPSLDELRVQPGIKRESVLDSVFYGGVDADGLSHDQSTRDIRRDIVDMSVRIVADASRKHESVQTIPVAVHAGEKDDDTWRERFAQLLAAVNPLSTGAGVTAEVVSQCAVAPSGFEKLIGAMSQTVFDGLSASGQKCVTTVRNHLVNAVDYADLAWCAAHGELIECPSWRKQREEKTEHMILKELQRHRRNDDPQTGSRTLPIPESVVSVTAHLLNDGKWSTPRQRAVAMQTRQSLRGYLE